MKIAFCIIDDVNRNLFIYFFKDIINIFFLNSSRQFFFYQPNRLYYSQIVAIKAKPSDL